MSETDLYIEEEVCIAMSIQEGGEVSITEPLTPDQTRNNAKGYVNRTPDETRFHRFCALGRRAAPSLSIKRSLKRKMLSASSGTFIITSMETTFYFLANQLKNALDI